MPSPFPGMDPFLESPEEFDELTWGLCHNAMAQLQRCLPMNYYAQVCKRAVKDLKGVTDESGSVRSGEFERRWSPSAMRPILVRLEEIEVAERFIQINCRKDGVETVVAVIQVLVPRNKNPMSPAREAYLREQGRLLRTSANLVEIDLLLDGVHSTAVPRKWLTRRVERFDYHVCVRRAVVPSSFEAYTFTLRDSLPMLSIPLSPDDQDVPLDLQAAFDRSYDDGPFAKRVDYREPPLSPEDAAWVADRLATVGK